MFYKKAYLKKAKKYYAQAVVKGAPVGTKVIAERLSKQCTVTRSDVYAVLMDLAGVMADYMAQGRSVQLEGLGTFRYTARSLTTEKPEEVGAKLIQGVRVRFVPEFTRPQGAKQVTRAIVADGIEWLPFEQEKKKKKEEKPGGGTPEQGGGTPGGQGENPLG